MASPRLAVLELAAGGRQVLEGWARRREAARALALWWRVVLACAGGMASSEVAAGLRVSRAMVARWRSRFAMARLEGLSGGRWPGAPGKVTGEHAGLVLAGMLEERGPGGARAGRPGRWRRRPVCRGRRFPGFYQASAFLAAVLAWPGAWFRGGQCPAGAGPAARCPECVP